MSHPTLTAATSSSLLPALWVGLKPFLPLLAVLLAAGLVLACPLPGRGPGAFARRDPWRAFKYELRRAVMTRAGHRCEAGLFLVVGRCRRPAVEADHVYPWSKGGATVIGNGQALCTLHNRRKGNVTPPWWYLVALESRRRRYFPVGADVRVRAALTAVDRAARARDGQMK